MAELLQLDRAECLRLLACHNFGRLAVNVGGSAPAIRPLNYVYDERSQSIVFRSDYGSKVFGLATTGKAAFEIDGVDPARRTGWSVIVVGVAEEVRNHFELRRLERAGLDSWTPGAKQHWLRIRTQLITGRRLVASQQSMAADQ
jgi:uncharacterized protein